VLHAWAGLGYYGRARNLHRAAVEIMARHGGKLPNEERTLRLLPGIGAYTAAAVAAIAFDKPATPVDGNVERVMARFFGIETPLPAAKPELRRLARGLTPARRPGDYAQGVMDLGATICLPRHPQCGRCPWRRGCAAYARGTASALPARQVKKPRRLRHGVVYWTLSPDGAVLLRRRPENGLLGGLMEFPTTEWRAQPWSAGEARTQAPVAARWRQLPGAVRHGFTHFELALTVFVGRARRRGKRAGSWSAVDRLGDHALPTLMKKVAQHVKEGDAAGVSRRRARP
jgi:A/G-specific adenine glycosylase